MRFVLLGLIVAYNPFYLYFLMSHGALGGMTRRMTASGVFLVMIVCSSFLALGRRKIRVQRTPFLFPVNVLLMFYVLAVVIGLARGNDFDYVLLDSFPPLEMFVIYYFVRFSPLMKDRFDFSKVIKWLLIYFFIMALADLVCYGLLTFVKGVGFGVLRAYVGGITVNRLMDFVLPLFLPFVVLSYKEVYRRRWVMILLLLSMLTVVLTFYRTIYLAVLAGLLYLAISKAGHFFFVGRLVISFVVVSLAIAIAWDPFLEQKGIDVRSLVRQRVVSIYMPDLDTDISATARITDTKEMMFSALRSFPGLAGVGGTYESGSGERVPIYVTCNYFLQLTLLFGIPAGLLFVWLYFRAFLTCRRLSREVKDISERVFFAASASLLVSLAIILCLFPYNGYFPLLYVLGSILGIADKRSEHLYRQRGFPGRRISLAGAPA